MTGYSPAIIQPPSLLARTAEAAGRSATAASRRRPIWAPSVLIGFGNQSVDFVAAAAAVVVVNEVIIGMDSSALDSILLAVSPPDDQMRGWIRGEKERTRMLMNPAILLGN